MALRNVGAPTVLVHSGNSQLTPSSTTFSKPFMVKVVNAAGAGIAGVTVTFKPPSTGASGTFAGGVTTAVTDISGIATSAAFTANSTTGTYQITASATGYTSAILQATNQNALKPLVVVQGSGQTATVGSAFTQTIKIKTLDLNNNPVPGVLVTFAVPSTGASVSFAGGVTSAVTDSTGVATSPVITANTKAGALAVTASVSGSLPVTVNLTNTPGAAATVTAVSGGSQTTTIETAFATPFKAKVTDTYGNLVPGVSVAFAAPGSGASLRYAGGSNTGVTGADGLATSSTMTANSMAGVYSVTASATGAATASFSMTNSAATAASITIFSGSGQTGTVANGFSQTLKVKAADSFGNPVAGVTVSFVSPSSGASGTFAGNLKTAVTGVDGVATSAAITANTVAGSYIVTASASGLGSLNFNLTNTAGTAATLGVAGGSGQSAKLGVAFTNPLKVSVADIYGNPVAGTTVTFTLPASGASATFAGGANTAVSGADGIATSAILTANNLAGGYSATATALSLSSKTFSLINTVFTVTTLEPVDGSSFRVRFNDAIATSGLQINDVYTGNVVTEEADLIVKDSNGTVVRGSMIVASDLKSLIFVKTGASFSPGAYSVKLRSGTTSFRGSDGKLLDGNGDGTPGGDYTSSFNAVATERTLSIPDVVRGPGQDLRVNTTDNGIPVKISEGQNVFTFEMSINYDPNLVNVSELVVATALTGNLEITYNVTVPGRIDIVGISPTGLPAGAQTLFYVRGSVPSGALYRTKCNIGVSDLKLYKLDGTSFSSTVDSGLMLNSYVGDVTGDGRYNSLDSLRIQRYLVNLDRWFTQYPLMDPVVIADVNGDARVNAIDSLFIQRYLVNMVVPFITVPPVSTVVQTPGLDPIIRLPKGLTAKRGQVVEVPIEIVNTDSQTIHVNSFEVAIAMDPKTFRMLKVNSKAQITQRYDARRGVLVIGGILPELKLEPGEGHILATLSLKVAANAITTDFALNLLDEAKFGRERYLTSVNSGDLVLLPAPTSGSNDSVDGKIRIMDGPNRKVSGGVEAFSVLKYRKNRFIGR
jgi:hypothetical protein